MDAWMIWLAVGAVMILLEFVIPGGIIVFLGVAAMAVGGAVHYGLITTIPNAFIAWFILSIFLMLFLRSVFMKYFEGDTSVENTDEDLDLVDSVVEVIEEVLPHKEGRVKFRDSTWKARSDEELAIGVKAIISGRDGNTLIIKSL